MSDKNRARRKVYKVGEPFVDAVTKKSARLTVEDIYIPCAPPLQTPDPENDSTRMLALPMRLRGAKLYGLADAFDALLEAEGDEGCLVDSPEIARATEAALLIAGHMMGPSLRFADGRRYIAETDYLVDEAERRICAGEVQASVLRDITEPLYLNGKPSGTEWPSDAAGLRRRIRERLRERGITSAS